MNADLCCCGTEIRASSRFDFFTDGIMWHLSIALVVLFGVMFSGCSTSPKTTDTARSTMEQLLLAQSLERTLVDARMPIDPAESVAVEAVGLTGDADFAKSLVEEWLRKKGLHVGGEAPKYLVRVILHAYGTQNTETFIGIPPIQSTFIPLATPELAIYKNIEQKGYARLNLEVSDKKSGALIAASPVFEDEVYYEATVWLFLISFKSTDIVPPPL